MYNPEIQPQKDEVKEVSVEDLVAEDKWSLPNTLGAVERAVEALIIRLEKEGWEKEEFSDFVEIAFREALVNAIVHGNYGVRNYDEAGGKRWHEIIGDIDKEPKGEVEVSLSIDSDEIRISVEDNGDGFDFDNISKEPVTANELQPSGRGILLIRHYSDDVFYSDEGRKITIIKKKK